MYTLSFYMCIYIYIRMETVVKLLVQLRIYSWLSGGRCWFRAFTLRKDIFQLEEGPCPRASYLDAQNLSFSYGP